MLQYNKTVSSMQERCFQQAPLWLIISCKSLINFILGHYLYQTFFLKISCHCYPSVAALMGNLVQIGLQSFFHGVMQICSVQLDNTVVKMPGASLYQHSQCCHYQELNQLCYVYTGQRNCVSTSVMNHRGSNNFPDQCRALL